jgi:hypothetical protein
MNFSGHFSTHLEKNKKLIGFTKKKKKKFI